MTAAQDHPYGFSPHSSASAEFDDPLDTLAAFDDDEYALGDEDDDQLVGQSATSNGAGVKKKKTNNRSGPHNLEKRNIHNATERARRDSLNGRFTTLAEALPTMRNVKRPSKAVIVTKALEFVYDSQVRERTLAEENNALRCEVDELRARLGMPALPPPQPLPESKMATASTMRKTKKQQSRKASAVSEAPLATPKTEIVEPTYPVAAQSASPATTQIASPASYAHPSPSSSTVSCGPTSSGLFDTVPTSASLFSAAFDAPSALPALSSSPVDSSASYSPRNPYLTPAAAPPVPPTSAAPNPFGLFGPGTAAAAMMHAQLAMLASAPPSSSSIAAFAPHAPAPPYLNPQVLFALQHQHQQAQVQAQAQAQAHLQAQAQAQAQAMQQVPYAMAAGMGVGAPGGADWLSAGPPQVATPQSGMFAVDGLGF
ncbi:hypothetical protein JCM8097_009495 [Rhodosporidiobolus ruineniae]